MKDKINETLNRLLDLIEVFDVVKSADFIALDQFRIMLNKEVDVILGLEDKFMEDYKASKIHSKEKGRPSRRIKSITDNFEFKSVSVAADFYNISSSSVTTSCNLKKEACGLRFEFLD